MEFAKLVPRCDQCVNLLMDYVAKQWHLVEYISPENFVMTLIFMSYGTLFIEHVNQLTAHTHRACPHPAYFTVHVSLFLRVCTCLIATAY